MDTGTSPTLAAVVAAAVDNTGAASGWLLQVDGDELVVVAAAGGHAVGSLTGSRRAVVGTAGFVASSGQPAALSVRPDDEANRGAGGAAGTPTSILAAPCVDEEVLGVLEVVDSGQGSFSFDDVELVSLLADIAGAALGEDQRSASVPPPQALGADLANLAATDPQRYAHIARAIEAMVG